MPKVQATHFTRAKLYRPSPSPCKKVSAEKKRYNTLDNTINEEDRSLEEPRGPALESGRLRLFTLTLL